MASRSIGALVRRIVVAYGVLVGAWFVAHLAWPDRWWWLVLLDKVAVSFLLAAIPVASLAIVWARSGLGLPAIVPVAVLAYFVHPFAVPKGTESVPPARADVRIATYNIWNQNKDVGAIVAAVRGIDPDILAVQEVMGDIEDELVAGLTTTLPHVHVGEPAYGGTTALFSRFAIDDVRELDLGIDRPAILARVTIAGRPLHVFGAHLYPSYYAYHDRPWREMPAAIERYIVDQRAQVRRLLEVVNDIADEDAASPVVLACDCNTQVTASSNRLLGTAFADAAAALGWQLGEPVDGARFLRGFAHIDYLWFRGDIAPVGSYRANDDGGSDHGPVFADFAFGAARREEIADR